MNEKTNKKLNDKSIYQIFVRNYSKEGTFKAVEDDLTRIKRMGFDILYLMPINKIGLENRKGSLGSPYAIADYTLINEELGSKEDFISLISKAHELGFLIMLDVVMNHTSYESDYAIKHPEWFYLKDNKFANKVGDWSDIIDLDYSNKDLIASASTMLADYVKLGVDGFRCDVASLVPLKFWKVAINKCHDINKNCFFLGESVEGYFIEEFRIAGFDIETDASLYECFDMLYDYDIFDAFNELIKDEISIKNYSKIVQRQLATYKEHDLKVRYLENHDKERSSNLIANLNSYNNYLSYIMFVKGVGFIYNGQEYHSKHLPSLFDKDTIDFDNREIDHSHLIKKLNSIRKLGHRFNPYQVIVNDLVLAGRFIGKENDLVGYFNIKQYRGKLKVDLKDGSYINLIDNQEIIVKDGEIDLISQAIIIEIKKDRK